MKFTIETKALEAALRTASVGIGGRSTLPILGNVRIKAEGEYITLSTTDLDIYVQQMASAKIEKEGSITAPFLILSQLVARMQSPKIAIKLIGKDLEFRSGEVVATIETLDATDFPEPFKRSEHCVECDAQEILKPLSLLQHAMGIDPSRYNLTGIELVPGGEFAATDGKRVAVYQGLEMSPDSALIPDVFVRAILKLAPTGPISVHVGNGHIAIVGADMEIAAKLIESMAANWKQAIPKEHGKALSCDRKELIRALQTCAIFVNKMLPGLFIEGKWKEVVVSQAGKASVTLLGTELTGQPEVKLRLNEKYLIDALNVLEGDDVRIQFSGSNSNVLIEEGKFKEVIMPIRFEPAK